MIDNHTATQHEFTRRCLRLFTEDIPPVKRQKLEEDLPVFAEGINHFGGYNLDDQLSTLTDANQELQFAFNLAGETCEKLETERDCLRVKIRDIAWAALKYEDATYLVKAYPSNGRYQRQLKKIHDILKAAQAEFGPDSNQLQGEQG